MLNIVEILGVSWGAANLVYDYLTGSAWWAWAVDAGILIAGVVTGGLIAAIRHAVKRKLGRWIKGLGRRRGAAL